MVLNTITLALTHLNNEYDQHLDCQLNIFIENYIYIANIFLSEYNVVGNGLTVKNTSYKFKNDFVCVSWAYIYILNVFF